MQRSELWLWFMNGALGALGAHHPTLTNEMFTENAAKRADAAVTEYEKRFGTTPPMSELMGPP